MKPENPDDGQRWTVRDYDAASTVVVETDVWRSLLPQITRPAPGWMTTGFKPMGFEHERLARYVDAVEKENHR
jgi:hypothetical protein